MDPIRKTAVTVNLVITHKRAFNGNTRVFAQTGPLIIASQCTSPNLPDKISDVIHALVVLLNQRGKSISAFHVRSFQCTETLPKNTTLIGPKHCQYVVFAGDAIGDVKRCLLEKVQKPH